MILPQVVFGRLYLQAYSFARDHYGDLGLASEVFARHVAAVVQKLLGPDLPDVAVLNFLRHLRTNDLYLSIACALRSEFAWRRFESDYRAYINKIAKQVSPNRDAADDLARGVMADLFFPDRSGESRIASFDGSCSLAAWLRIVIKHRAIDDLEHRWNTVERLDSVPDIPDERSFQRLGDGLRAGRYGTMISKSFTAAVNTLTHSDRVLLLLRYDQKLQARQIAENDGVHPSTIARRLRQVHERFRDSVVSTLAREHRLSSEAMKECLTDILENPAHSIMMLINPRCSETSSTSRSWTAQKPPRAVVREVSPSLRKAAATSLSWPRLRS